MVVLDADEHLLLFHTHDPVNPDLGQWWALPGGGIEPEETYQQAAVRELREETGILVEPGQVGPQPPLARPGDISASAQAPCPERGDRRSPAGHQRSRGRRVRPAGL